MKKDLNNILLEAVNRGLKLALDDFDDNEELVGQQTQVIKDKNITRKNLVLSDNFVDLDLPSGTLWAKYNLGVDPNKLDVARNWFGDYYQWGETHSVFNPIVNGYTHDYNIDTHKLLSSSELYNRRYNKKDKLNELLPEDDPVFVQYRSRYYHTPTIEQFQELKNNTTKKWVEDYCGIVGLNGLLLKGKNGEELFFPANGFINNKQFVFVWESPYLWSKNHYIDKYDSNSHYGPHCFSYHNSYSQYDFISLDWMVREHACCIRAVCNLD